MITFTFLLKKQIRRTTYTVRIVRIYKYTVVYCKVPCIDLYHYEKKKDRIMNNCLTNYLIKSIIILIITSLINPKF